MLLAGGKLGVDHSGVLGRVMGTCEQVILSAQRLGPDAVLDQVIIYLELTVQGIELHIVHQRQGVGHGLADGAAGQDPGVFLLHPLFELG
jgi:hypothetical protein